MVTQADRVAVTSTTTGTGGLVLAGAILGHQTFATAFGTGGNTEIHYGILQDETGEWEVGLGTYLGISNSLQRDTVLASSTGSAVSFPSGSKTVYVLTPAYSTVVAISRRPTDVAVEAKSAASQSAPVVQAYDASGNVAFRVLPSGQVEVLTGGSTVVASLGSAGLVHGAYATFGNYVVGGVPDGSAGATQLSAITGSDFILRSGNSVAGAFSFRLVDNTGVARIDAGGTSAANPLTIITREKGDARYAAISARRFKEAIEDADPAELAAIFPQLRLRRFRYGGELPESDERRGKAGLGFVLEELQPALPEACRTLAGKVHSRDDGALLAVAYAKIAELEVRLAALEAGASPKRRPKGRE